MSLLWEEHLISLYMFLFQIPLAPPPHSHPGLSLFVPLPAPQNLWLKTSRWKNNSISTNCFWSSQSFSLENWRTGELKNWRTGEMRTGCAWTAGERAVGWVVQFVRVVRVVRVVQIKSVDQSNPLMKSSSFSRKFDGISKFSFLTVNFYVIILWRYRKIGEKKGGSGSGKISSRWTLKKYVTRQDVLPVLCVFVKLRRYCVASAIS